MSWNADTLGGMEPIYDRTGAVVAWLESGRLRSLSGHVIGWLHADAVYGLRGQSIGHFDDGTFRDRHGAVVGFIRGASPGVVLPVPVSYTHLTLPTIYS